MNDLLPRLDETEAAWIERVAPDVAQWTRRATFDADTRQAVALGYFAAIHGIMQTASTYEHPSLVGVTEQFLVGYLAMSRARRTALFQTLLAQARKASDEGVRVDRVDPYDAGPGWFSGPPCGSDPGAQSEAPDA